MIDKPFSLKQPFTWLLLLLIIGLFALKYEAFFLPFFWDEAWVYMPAIRTMAESGPSILPGSIDADLYTGHPLLFYFLAASWIKFWGYSLPVAHLFPMLNATALLISSYYIAFKISLSHFTAFLTALLITIQTNFLTQSSFLLIEVWLSLLFLWTFYFYYQKQWLGFAIAMLLALWSKESAYCLVPAFILVGALEFLLKKKSAKELIQLTGIVLAVFLLGFSFFILQKIKLGWLFFPRHANWVNVEEFLGKFEMAILTVFLAEGRIYLFILAAVIFGFTHFNNQAKFNSGQGVLLVGIFLFTAGFILFASINFFSARYLFGSIPLLMLAIALMLQNLSNWKHRYLFLIALFIFGCNNIYDSFYKRPFSDMNLSYVFLLKAQVEMVDYLEKHPTQEKINAPFLMQINLQNPYSGFVKKGYPNMASDINDDDIEYFIMAPNEEHPAFEEVRKSKNLKLLHRTQYQHAWVELYKNEGVLRKKD